jgi:hypothetical protein
MNEPIKIVLFLDGGVIQDILISSGKVEAYVIGYDIEGLDPEDIMMVSFSASDGEPVREQACVSYWARLEADPKFICRLEEDFKKHQQKKDKILKEGL